MEVEALSDERLHERPDYLIPECEIDEYGYSENEPNDIERSYDEMLLDFDTIPLVCAVNTVILFIKKKQTQLNVTINELEKIVMKFYIEWNEKFRQRIGESSAMMYWTNTIEPYLLEYDSRVGKYADKALDIKQNDNVMINDFLAVCDELDSYCVDSYCVDIDELEQQSEELIGNIDNSIRKLTKYIKDLKECLNTLDHYYFEWRDPIPDELIEIILEYWDDKHHIKYGTLAQINTRWNRIIKTKYLRQYKQDENWRTKYIYNCRKSAYRMGKLLLSRKHEAFDTAGFNEQFVLSKYNIRPNLYSDMNFEVLTGMTELTKDLHFTIYSLEFHYYEDRIKITVNKHKDKFVSFCERFFPSYGKTMVNLMMETAIAVTEDDNALLKFLM